MSFSDTNSNPPPVAGAERRAIPKKPCILQLIEALLSIMLRLVQPPRRHSVNTLKVIEDLAHVNFFHIAPCPLVMDNEDPSNLHHTVLARVVSLHGGFVAGDWGVCALLSILAWWPLVRDQPLPP